MSERPHNFYPGPASMPTEVLREAQEEFLNIEGSGLCLMEMSHRDPIYERLHDEAVDALRELYAIPKNYVVMFGTGGARMQFALAPMNLRTEGSAAAYIVTGTWGKQALGEAQKLMEATCAYSSEDSRFDHVPQEPVNVADDASFLHYTSNNTLFGTQFAEVPKAPSAVPVVCDMSSDILSAPLDISKFGIIYGGAQKNAGPSGVSLVIMREDLLERSAADLPMMMSYKLAAQYNSMLNTPPTYGIYLVGKVAKHWLKRGGLEVRAAENRAKAEMLYGVIDQNPEFFRLHARKSSRSLMNICFRLPSEDLEERFLEGAEALDMRGLRGHRSVGGLRASLYNAVRKESCAALAEYMQEFVAKSG